MPRPESVVGQTALQNEVPVDRLGGQLVLEIVNSAFAARLVFRFADESLHAAEPTALDLVELHAKTKTAIWILSCHRMLLNVLERALGCAVQIAVDARDLAAPVPPL